MPGTELIAYSEILLCGTVQSKNVCIAVLILFSEIEEPKTDKLQH